MRVLIIGRGSIGTAIAEHFKKDAKHEYYHASAQPFFAPTHAWDAIIFAQGANCSNTCTSEEVMWDTSQMFEANCVFVLRIMRVIDTRQLRSVVIVSSLWETHTRTGKLSYTISKAAVGGLVRSLAAEKREWYVNSLACGPVDNDMTRRTMSITDREAWIARSPHGRLPEMAEVVNSAYFLATSQHGISGQCIHVDLGWSVV